MYAFTRRAAIALTFAALSGLMACGTGSDVTTTRAAGPLYPNETPQLRRLIEASAVQNDVPVDLVQRVILRESSHRPEARNGPYMGLMQINPQTARTMGFRGDPAELLDAQTNLRYAVKYLRGAWLVADGNRDKAVNWYARGYYYEARDRGLLDVVGLR